MCTCMCTCVHILVVPVNILYCEPPAMEIARQGKKKQEKLHLRLLVLAGFVMILFWTSFVSTFFSASSDIFLLRSSTYKERESGRKEGREKKRGEGKGGGEGGREGGRGRVNKQRETGFTHCQVYAYSSTCST